MSFHEFSTQYRKEAELNTQSWSEFCKSMVEEFTKALVKMEIEAEAANVFNMLTGKGFGGGGGIGDVVKSLAGGGKNTEEIAGGVVTGGTTASKVGGGSALPFIAGAVFAGEKVYKMESARKDYLKNTPVDKRQEDTKQYIESLFHMGKYEKREEGVYSDPKGYEAYMAKTGIEPYPLAKGGIGIVTRPTPFIMGEAGPEMFNIQPLSKVQNEFITNKKDTYVNGNRSDNFNVYISFPNATLDSVDQNQIDRFVSKAIPSLRRAVSNGELS
jgi:hypothetical protein